MTNAPPSPHVLMTADCVGGVWSYALDLAGSLIEAGVKVTLVTLGPAPGAAQRAKARRIDGLELVHTGLPLDWTAKARDEIENGAAALAAVARWAEADLIHLNHPAFGVGDFHAPVIAVAHSCVATWWRAVRGGALPEDFAWRSELVQAGYQRAAAVLAPSAAFARMTAEAYRLFRQPIVVRNGRSHPTKDRPRRGKSAAFAFTAGRLWDDGKNLCALDRAAGRLRHPVLAAGPTTGPNGAAIQFERIRALGTLDFNALDHWLRRAPLFVSTARYEPFGLCVLEAAQRGCALVLSDIPSFRELWDDVAEFAPADDDEAIAAAIDRVLRDDAHAKRLAAAARKRARRYSVEAMRSATLGVYRRTAPGAFVTAQLEAAE